MDPCQRRECFQKESLLCKKLKSSSDSRKLLHVAIDKVSIPFRLMPDQMKRLHKIATKRGLSKQQFIEAAVLREVNEYEESLQRSKETETVLADRKTDNSPGKLGIVDRLKQQERRHEVSESPTPAPVVVNVGSNTTSGGADIIERLANFVLAGNDFERSTRLRTAVNILKDTTPTEEERKVLAARLDEAIAAKTNSTTPSGGQVVRTARMAFDKIVGLLNK